MATLTDESLYANMFGLDEENQLQVGPKATLAPGHKHETSHSVSGRHLSSYFRPSTPQLPRTEAQFLTPTIPASTPTLSEKPSIIVLRETKEPGTSVSHDSIPDMNTQDTANELPERKWCGCANSKHTLVLVGTVCFVIIAITLGTILGLIYSNNDSDGDKMKDIMYPVTSTLRTAPAPTFTSYPLPTGPWSISEPVDVESGICGEHPQAVDRCLDPYSLDFNLYKDHLGYWVESDFGKYLNGEYLTPPNWDDGLYSYNVTTEFTSYERGSFVCNTTVDARLLVGRDYRFHVIFHYVLPRSCKLENGYVAREGQTCHCEWMGYIYKWDHTSKTIDPTPTYTHLMTLPKRALLDIPTAIEREVIPTDIPDEIESNLPPGTGTFVAADTDIPDAIGFILPPGTAVILGPPTKG